jgi:hypothetical protein
VPILSGSGYPITGVSPLLAWTSPDGVLWNLGQPSLGYFAAQGVKGLGAIPVTFTTDEESRGGELVRNIQPTPRFITLPLCFAGYATHVDFLSAWRELAAAFTSTRYAGPGQLSVIRPDGTVRVIDAYYQDGYDGDPEHGVVDDLMALTLRCPKPWFRDSAAVTVANVHDSGVRDFLSPYPAVSSGSTLGATAVANAGGVEAWPSWVITGPASEIIATSNTTGESWTLTPSDPSTGHGDLLAGETITITTDPPSVRGPLGENWSGALDWPTAVLWSLRPGENDIEYTVTGSGVTTSISLTYYPQYETA